MRLPNANRARVEPEKVRDYLLSPAHLVGRYKAAFFASLGYAQSEWERLRSDLLELPLQCDARRGADSPHGAKYEVEGTLIGPNGRSARVVTVWILLTGDSVPRFVTAYPG